MIEKLQESINNLKENKQIFYFFVANKGNYPLQSVAHLYRVASDLRSLGKKVQFLHTTSEYVVPSWFPEAITFEHKPIDSSIVFNLEDFIILSEDQYAVMEQLKNANISSKRILFLQEYEYLTDIMPIGKKFIDVGVIDAITNSKSTQQYINNYFNPIRCEVITPGISDLFKIGSKPRKPEVVVFYRNPRDFQKAVKLLALRKPFLSFVEFIDVNTLSEEQLAEKLSEACLAVSLDVYDTSGTFFLQTLNSGIDVVAMAPFMVQPFMTDKSAWWVNSIEDAMDITEQYLQGFLQDTLTSEMSINRSQIDTTQYTTQKRKELVTEIFSKLVEVRIKETEEIINQQVQTVA